MATPILEIPEVSTSILSFALLNIVLRHYEQAASNRIIDSLSTPPTTPPDGDAYFVLASPTGLWSGQAGKIAFSISGAWYFMNAIPQIPYFKSSTNTLVTLNPTTATEGTFSSGGGSAGASYYTVTATSSGAVNIPFNTYPDHSVVFVDCSAVTQDYIGLDINLDLLTGSTGGKKIEIIFHDAPSNVMYVYNAGLFGSYSLPTNDIIYRNNNLFFITYEVNFTTSTVLVHDTSMPTDVYETGNYSNPVSNTAVIEGQDKRGVYTYNGGLISGGGATLTLTWDDTYIQNVFENLHWRIVIYSLPVAVTSVVVAAPSGANSGLNGVLSKTPINRTVSYDWVFSVANGGWIVS